MAQTIAGTFADRMAAQTAVERLRAAGVPAADISMIVRDTETAAASAYRATGTAAGTAAPSLNPARSAGEPAVATQVKDDEVEPETVEDYSGAATGAATGGIIGALGGLLIGLGALALPGFGPVIAAGPLAGLLGGAAIGAATGGLIGALVDLGVPEEYASTYARDVERGHVLVTVRADAASPADAREIMRQSGALNVYPPVGTLT
jgi:hypothetical protein